MTDQKTALVTAGASGIGLVTVQVLLRDGWRVIVGDIDEALGQREAERLGFEFRLCDVRHPAQIESLFDGLNHLDLLVNNAGIMGPSCATWECPVDGWQETLDVNLTAQMIACKSAVPMMIDRGSRCHRQHELRCRPARMADPCGLSRQQVGCAGTHGNACRRSRPPWRSGQCPFARRC